MQPSYLQIYDAHAPTHPQKVHLKAWFKWLWSSSDAHMCIVGTFWCGQRSAWVLLLICGYASQNTGIWNIPCVLTSFLIVSIKDFSILGSSGSSVGWVGLRWLALHTHIGALECPWSCCPCWIVITEYHFSHFQSLRSFYSPMLLVTCSLTVH